MTLALSIQTPISKRPAYPSPALPTTYVPLPRRLLEDLRDAPAAIGVYALIGRLTQTTGAAIPLSAGDLQAYDPALSYGKARRALERLVDAGYALAEGKDGLKRVYRPTWGQVKGAPLAWDRQAPNLGRPRHIPAVRLDDRLLDLCLGRLRPHGAHPAVVERYLAAPLIGIHEVGCYALALAGLPVTSPTLAGLGLLNSTNTALPLPDERTILAVASQRAAGDPAATLTSAGWRRLGLAPAAPVTPTGDPLVFVPTGMIGSMIGGVIGTLIALPPAAEVASTASESLKSPALSTAAGSHGATDHDRESSTILPDAIATKSLDGGVINTFRSEHSDRLPARAERQASKPRITTTNPAAFVPASRTVPGAQSPQGPRAVPGVQLPQGTCTNAPATEPASPPTNLNLTPSARLLRGLGVRTDVAAALADRPTEQVERVIARARARQDVYDLAGWVVSALRALPVADELAPPPPRVTETPILRHPRLSGYERQRWLNRFRKADPADRPAILARFHTEHPLEECDVAAV